jgi:molybdopterin converting factor small subunit
VKELVRTLVELHGRPFSDLVLDQSGDLVDYLTYLIDGVNIHSLNGFETELRDGETVVIAPPIVGG